MLKMPGYKDWPSPVKAIYLLVFFADELVVFCGLLLICSPTLSSYLQIPSMFLSAWEYCVIFWQWFILLSVSQNSSTDNYFNSISKQPSHLVSVDFLGMILVFNTP